MLTRTIQLKWDFFQPLVTDPSANFDLRLDKVIMVTAKDALANGICNPANVSNSATIANVPAS